MPRVCKRCGRDLPADSRPKQTYHRECLQQRPSIERERLAQIRAALGWREVEAAPDHRIAVTLRQELVRDRLQGYPFDLIWADEVDAVIDAFRRAGVLSRSEAEAWQEVFQSTEPAWRSAYERSGSSVSGLTAELAA